MPATRNAATGPEQREPEHEPDTEVDAEVDSPRSGDALPAVQQPVQIELQAKEKQQKDDTELRAEFDLNSEDDDRNTCHRRQPAPRQTATFHPDDNDTDHRLSATPRRA